MTDGRGKEDDDKLTPFEEWILVLQFWAQTDNGEPMACYLADPSFLTLTPEELSQVMPGVASVIRVLHARGQKGPAHRPKGTLDRWRDPNQIAAYYVRYDIARWKQTTGHDKIPAAECKRFIEIRVAELRDSNFPNRRKTSVARVAALVNGPRKRRLPAP